NALAPLSGRGARRARGRGQRAGRGGARHHAPLAAGPPGPCAGTRRGRARSGTRGGIRRAAADAHRAPPRQDHRSPIDPGRGADLASYKGSLVLELKPRKEDVLVGSEPAGARIKVDGHDAGKVTPAAIAVDGCVERTIALEHEGYRPWSHAYDADDDFDAMVETLKKVTLEPIPTGTLVIKKPREYEVEVLEGETRLGKAGDTITLIEGKHALTLRNAKMFVKETSQVEIAGGRTATPLITFPSLGTLTVQAQPSNCQVFVDGQYVDVTPVLDLPIGSGAHRVKVVFVPTGASQEVAVAVDGGKNARVTVKF